MDRAKLQLSVIEFAITQFAKYSMEIETYFGNEIERIDAIFSTISVEQDGDEIRRPHPEEYVDFLSENYQEMETIFPNHFRASFLIQIMSLFEYELKRVCNIHSDVNKSKYTISDLYGTDIDKCKKYLEKSAAIDFQKLNPEWDKIKLFYKIRNKFIHHSGTISQDDSDYKAIKRLEHRGLIHDPGLITIEMVGLEYEIKLRKELNAILLETISLFFKKLLKDNMEIHYVADYI